MNINAIALGKKQMCFLDYEAVITPGNEYNTLTSVNIVREGKILVKIKTDIPLEYINTLKLEPVIEQIIVDYLTGKETGAFQPDKSNFTVNKKTSKKQGKARTKAANDLFNILNL